MSCSVLCWRSRHVRLEGLSPPFDIVALNVASCVGALPPALVRCLLRWCVASLVRLCIIWRCPLTGCAPASRRLLFAMILADCTGGLQVINKPEG